MFPRARFAATSAWATIGLPLRGALAESSRCQATAVG